MKHVLLSMFIMPAAVHAATYYVATNGNNNAAGTQAAPWRTIQYAVTNAMPGDTVVIGGGRYREHVRLIRSGTNNAPITFAAAPGAVPVIDGENTVPPGNHSWAGLFEVVGRHNIRVEGLSAINSYSAGFFLRWATNVVVARCSTSNTFTSGLQAWRSHTIQFVSNDVQFACMGTNTGVDLQECITVSGTTNFVVAFNHVYNRPITSDSPGGEGIDAKQACFRGAIHHNIIHGIPGELALYVDAYNETLREIDVYNNLIFGCKNGIVTAAEVSSGRVYDLRIFNNIVYGTLRHGIEVADYDADARRERIYIYNNLCYSNGYRIVSPWGAGIYVSSKNVRDVFIWNNICHQNKSFQLGVSSSADPYVKASHNLVYPYRNYNGGTEYEIRGAAYVEAHPLYVSEAGFDFHPTEFSPTRDAGTNLAWHTGAFDFDGAPRIHDARVDIGAYEFVPEPQALALLLALTLAARQGRCAARLHRNR